MFLGKPRESLRALLLKPWFEMEITHRFQRRDFTPAPRVDVVMLRLRKRGPPLVKNTDRQCFRDFVTHVFTAWQPALDSALKSIFTRQQLKYLKRDLAFDLDVSPAYLPFEQWLHLFEHFKMVRDERTMQVIAGSEKDLLRQQQKLQKVHRTRSGR